MLGDTGNKPAVRILLECMYTCLQSFQESLGIAGNIAYIDVDTGEHLAHIRCFDTESAKSVATAGIGGYTLKLLQGM